MKATLDHAVDPATESRYAAGLIAGYQATEVVDPHTAVVRLDRPNASFLQALSAPYLGIQSPKALRGDPAGRCDKPVGSGPFSFVRWEKKVGVELSRNPDYAWPPKDAGHTGPARLDSLRITFVPEDTVRIGTLTSGQVQAVASVPPGRAKTLGGTVLKLLKAESPGPPYNHLPQPLRAGHRPWPTSGSARRCAARPRPRPAPVKAVYFGAVPARLEPVERPPPRSTTTPPRARSPSTRPRLTGCSTRPAGAPATRRATGSGTAGGSPCAGRTPPTWSVTSAA